MENSLITVHWEVFFLLANRCDDVYWRPSIKLRIQQRDVELYGLSRIQNLLERSTICCLEANSSITIVWLFPQLRRAATRAVRYLFSNLLFFGYVQTCNKCRGDFLLSSQHDNEIAIALDCSKKVVLMLPWESHPQFDVIDQVFIPRDMRIFNCGAHSNTKLRADVMDVKRVSRGSHVHVKPQLNKSLITCRQIKFH